ncbi:MAG: PAS domain S-box protein, partial [Pedosphaera parvula]|nr:PAS domain S-box protein [Pedosphaera parvula]
RNGAEFWAQLAISAIIDDEGRYVGALAMVTEVTERKRAEEALRQSEEHYRELFLEARLMQEKLRSLSNRILFAQEEERKRISRELHDEVGQALTAINVNLAMLKRETAEKRNAGDRKIEEAQALLEQTMANVHRFARELRPAMLDDLGLIPALRSYTKDFGERTGITVHLTADLSEADLDGERKTVLYRVAQESLNNIAKHARASEVELAPHRQEDRVRMEIKDNGQGFQVDARAAKETSRLGLLGMEERVRLVNGTFALESSPGQGTRLLVAIPVRKV